MYSNHIINFSERHSTILVTGCSGFIGSHLVDRLLKEAENYRYEIRCMTRDVDSIEGFFNEGSRQNVETSIHITQYLYKESFVLPQFLSIYYHSGEITAEQMSTLFPQQ